MATRKRIGMALAFGATMLVSAACRPAALGAGGGGPSPATESRVYDSRARAFIDFRALAEAASRVDVVFFGEQHDDQAGHRAELAFLAAVGARRPNVVVSLEMFDRDVQPVLDAYLAGQMPESTFLAQSRPWTRYATDYRALVELARANGWPVVASNPPRRFATSVSRVGIAMLDTMNAGDRAMIARELSCPRDTYFDRFAQSMTGHSAGGGPGSVTDTAAAAAMTWRFYEAQCVKDETMGESIAAAHARAGRGAIVVHYNGAFHTDRGLGTAERALKRMPGATSMVVTAVPVANLGSVDPARFADRADYIVLTPRP